MALLLYNVMSNAAYTVHAYQRIMSTDRWSMTASYVCI